MSGTSIDDIKTVRIVDGRVNSTVNRRQGRTRVNTGINTGVNSGTSPEEHVFNVTISGLTDLSSRDSGKYATFRQSLDGNRVTFQWTQFSGRVRSEGVSHLSISSNIPNLPEFPLHFPLYLKHNGRHKISTIKIDPEDVTENVKIYFHIDKSPDSCIGDFIEIEGSSISWLVQ